MTESVSSSSNISMNALSDLKLFFRTGESKYDNADSNEENETKENIKNSYVTKKALNELLTKYNGYNSEIAKDKSEEKQNNNTQTDPLKINTPLQSDQSPLEIKQADINTEIKQSSYSIPKQKNTILYELRSNAMQQKLTAWDIAKKYGISYIQAQEIFIELNQDKNGIVKEFNIPQNSTVSYLV